MKVLFITPKFYPSIGGVEKHVLKISEELLRRGHEVDVVTESIPKNYNTKYSNYQSSTKSDKVGTYSKKPVKSSYSASGKGKSITIYSFAFGHQNWMKKFKIWLILLNNLKLFKDVDVIHCHDVFVWYLPLRFLLYKKKVFITFHGYETYPLPLKNILLHKISELLTFGNICVGDFIAKWYKAKPDFVIYGGVDVETFNKEKKTKDKDTALFFGRLDAQTNVLDYSRAAKKLEKKIPGFKLIVFGDGQLKKAVERFVKVSDFILTPEKIIPDYKYIFISRYLSILEALLARRPVFAFYDNPIKKDYLEMSPFKDFISISGSVGELVENVYDYHSDSTAGLKKTEAGYKWARNQSWGRITDIYLKLWKKS